MTDKGFTKIPNELFDVLLSSDLVGSEVKILVFIARKTYGFHKESDQISLSQFQNKLGISRQTVVDGLHKLQLVKLIRLVKKGSSRKASNEWLIDLSDYQDKLVNLSRLVYSTTKKLVRQSRHTKESITKERKVFKKPIVSPTHLESWEEADPGEYRGGGIVTLVELVNGQKKITEFSEAEFDAREGSA